MVFLQKLPEEKTEADPVTTLTDLVQLGSLPVKCGIRLVEDNPSDPLLIQPKVVKGEPTKPGAYPWQVEKKVFIFLLRNVITFSNSGGSSSEK
jgi:hypothetical protein